MKNLSDRMGYKTLKSQYYEGLEKDTELADIEE